MYLILKRGKLKKIIEISAKKAGNIRKLEKKLDISRSNLSAYHMEKMPINVRNLQKLVKYAKITIKKEDIIKELADNFKQIKGGINCVKMKIANGTFDKLLKLCQKGSSEYMKRWHKLRKKGNPEAYYKKQYENFKLIGNYKYKTKNGETVRNKLEKEVADILKNLKIDYEYEPLIKSQNKYFFPDFLIKNKVIVECTMWRGKDKAIKLKNKIKYLRGNYRVFVIIPKNLNRYYEILNKHLILGLDEFVPVAQTFRDLK